MHGLTISSSGRKMVIAKKNELIEGHYSLSAIAQKMAAALLARVNPKAELLPVFEFTRDQVINILGIDRRSYVRDIDKVTSELQAIVIIIDTPSEKKKINMFHQSIFAKEDQSVRFIFHEDIEPYIRDFRGNFTQYQFQQIQNLRSRYSIRLYEILRRRHGLQKQGESVYEFDLENLRGMLGVEDKYLAIQNFKNRVLNYAQAELDEKTDLSFTYRCKYKGRKIGAIEFTIRHNERFEALPEDESLEAEVLPGTVDEGMLSMLKMLMPDMAEQDALLLITGYDKTLLTEALMDYSRAAVKGEIKDPKGYLMGILKHKRQEDPAPARKHQTTAEKLNDRDWAEGLGLEVPDEIR